MLLIISIIGSKISNSDENSIRVVTFLKIHNNPEISLKVLEDGILCWSIEIWSYPKKVLFLPDFVLVWLFVFLHFLWIINIFACDAHSLNYGTFQNNYHQLKMVKIHLKIIQLYDVVYLKSGLFIWFENVLDSPKRFSLTPIFANLKFCIFCTSF